MIIYKKNCGFTRLVDFGDALTSVKAHLNASPKFTTGFTLMETMVYIVLFGILMSGVVVGTYNLLEGNNRNIASTEIQEEGIFINRKINWALSGATGASVSSGGSTITITRPDLGAQSPLVISGNGTIITIARGVGVPAQLNSDRYSVSNLVFSYTAGINGRPPSVGVNYLVEDKPFNFRTYLRH